MRALRCPPTGLAVGQDCRGQHPSQSSVWRALSARLVLAPAPESARWRQWVPRPQRPRAVWSAPAVPAAQALEPGTRPADRTRLLPPPERTTVEGTFGVT